MEKAYSFAKNKIISASSAEYRQNLDEQIVCPTCFEQVFKKKLWVLSKQSHTHFFSHYYGDQESCPDRTSGEDSFDNEREKKAQLQRLEIFNKYFRKYITEALAKIVHKKVLHSLSSAIEYAERLCVKDISNPILEKLELRLLKNLSEPITATINGNLESLEEALIPIYNHLNSQHGSKNLKFVTSIVLLQIFHKDRLHLEDILKNDVIKSKTELDKLLLGNSVLLLSNSIYVNYKKSLSSIHNFLTEISEREINNKNLSKKSTLKREVEKNNVENTESSQYFACPQCNKKYYLRPYTYLNCSSCNNWFSAIASSRIKKSTKTSAVASSEHKFSSDENNYLRYKSSGNEVLNPATAWPFIQKK